MTIMAVDPRGARRQGAVDVESAGSVIPACARVEALRFLAAYAYSPSGTDPVSRRSRRWCAAIKAAEPQALAAGARTLAGFVRQRPEFATLLERGAMLVPVPASAPRLTAGTGVCVELALALARCGIGAGVCEVLVRDAPVRKSATAPAGARPTVAIHYASLRIVAASTGSAAAAHILVDDVVSRGRTLLAAACRLREHFPRTPILALALMRTLGYVTAIPGLTAPCVGEIRWRHGDAVRRP